MVYAWGRSHEHPGFPIGPMFVCHDPHWHDFGMRPLHFLCSQNAGDSGGASTPPRRGFISLGWQAPYGTAGSFRVRAMTGHEGGVASMTAHPRRVEGLPWLALSG